MEIVINNCYGGFSLSKAGEDAYKIKSGKNFTRQIPRNDSALIEVVKELRVEANGTFAELRIVEIPKGVSWYIEEYDGNEWVAEKHRTWR